MLTSIAILTLFFLVQFIPLQKKDSLGLNTHILSSDKKYTKEYTYIALSSVLIIVSISYLYLSGKTLKDMYIAIPSFTTESFNYWLLMFIGVSYLFIITILSLILFASDKLAGDKGMNVSVNKTKINSDKEKEKMLKTLSIFKQDKTILIENLKNFEKINTLKLIIGIISANLIVIFILDLVVNYRSGLNIFVTVLIISIIISLFRMKLSIVQFILGIVPPFIYTTLILASGSIIFYSIISLLIMMLSQNIVNALGKIIEQKESIVDSMDKAINDYEIEKNPKKTEDKDAS